MPRLTFVHPGSLDTRTGGSIYDRKVVEALRENGWWVDVLEWPATFPFPSEEQRLEVAASLSDLPDNALVMIDGLALGTLPGLARKEMGRLRLVAMVHHPLALETGLSPMMAATFASEERDALQCARAVIVTSATTAAILEGAFAVPAELITVAEPGVDRPQGHRDARAPGPVRIFAMGQIAPRKAHHILVEALSQIADLDFECAIAGNLERDPDTADDLTRQIRDRGLSDRVRLVGEVSEKQAARFYAQADIFALASVYEGYGMVFAEALANGLPIVATTGGAIPEVVPSDAGLLVEPNDPEAFAGALRSLVSDESMREKFARQSRKTGESLSSWTTTASKIETALSGL